jgi:inner membrane transporter RhtA
VSRSDVVPAPVLVVGAIASVQSGAAVATRLFPDVGVGGTVFLRLVLSAVILVALVRPRTDTLRRMPRSGTVQVVGFGVVLAAMNGLFYLAIARIPLGVAVTVEFLGPLGVAIAGSRRRLDLTWAALAAVGVVLLAGSGGRLDPVGIALAAAAGGFWAAYILLSQRVGAAVEGMTGLALALAVGSVVMAPFGIVSGGTGLLGPEVLARGLAVAVLSSAVPYSLELAALRRMRSSVFGVLMSLEPAMAALSGVLLLHQHLHRAEWLAIVLVMAASIGATTSTSRSATADAPAEPAGAEHGVRPIEVLG